MHPFVVHALRSDTLPPATHTNTTVVGGRWIIDPGSPDEDAIDALVSAVDATLVEGIILTHRHRDHVAGTELLRARIDVPVYAHVLTRDEVAHKIRVDRTLADGDSLALPDGSALSVLFTPGHARGHICLWHAPSGGMAVGDMVAGSGSILIASPDGDVADYITSLKRTRTLAPRFLIPAHGPVVKAALAKLDEYIAHRLRRETLVLHAVPAVPVGLDAIVARAYAGTPVAMLPWAALAASAHLDKLVREGRVHKVGEQFCTSPK